MENTIQLELKAKHYKGTTFAGSKPYYRSGCAIEIALFDQLKTKRVMELVDESKINGVAYIHQTYNDSKYYRDKTKAEKSHPNKVIRTIILTKA